MRLFVCRMPLPEKPREGFPANTVQARDKPRAPCQGRRRGGTDAFGDVPGASNDTADNAVGSGAFVPVNVDDDSVNYLDQRFDPGPGDLDLRAATALARTRGLRERRPPVYTPTSYEGGNSDCGVGDPHGAEWHDHPPELRRPGDAGCIVDGPLSTPLAIIEFRAQWRSPCGVSRLSFKLRLNECLGCRPAGQELQAVFGRRCRFCCIDEHHQPRIGR